MATQPREFKALQDLTAAIGLAATLPFEVDFWKIQNAFFRLPAEVVSAQRAAAGQGEVPAQEWLTCHEVLGTLLRIQPPPNH